MNLDPSAAALPRWETDSIYPGLGSRAYLTGREQIVADLARLEALYDRHDIRGGAPRTPTAADAAPLAEALGATNDLLEQIQAFDAYITAFVTTDARNEQAAAEEAGLESELTGLARLQTRFDAWVGRSGAAALTDLGGIGAEHAHALRQAATAAGHQMSEDQEDLLTDLRLSGGSAWSRLAGDLTSTLAGTLDEELVPVTQLRGKAMDPDAGTRRAAFAAELAAWETVAVPMAACLNGIKGEVATVNRRRGWVDAIEPALHLNSVTRPTLQVMQAAAEASFPDFRRYLRAKARLLGDRDGDALAWWDMFAPVPGEARVSWPEAGDAVREAFATFSPQLEGLARRALADHWVDAEPRDGKRGGAFCMPVRGTESRILMNFDGSWDSVQTLAHELGHAYHNTNLATRTPLQRRTPMALAETASIFCETVMVQAGLTSAGDSDRLALLNMDLQGACQVVVDIHSRFLFEREVFTRREKEPIPPSVLCGLMTDAQRCAYGDGLRDETLHPYMWAVKPHYYSPSVSFYNWPYCFGLLFGIGLYAEFTADPGRFRSGYDDLLASTGMDDAATLAARFGIDITAESFWASSLDVIRARVDAFVALVDAGGSTSLAPSPSPGA